MYGSTNHDDRMDMVRTLYAFARVCNLRCAKDNSGRNTTDCK